MSKIIDIPNTRAMLYERRMFYKQALQLMNEVDAALDCGEKIVFEVHIRKDVFTSKAIMTEGENLLETIRRAKKLFQVHNSLCGKRDVEVFARFLNGLKLALDPIDVRRLLPENRTSDDLYVIIYERIAASPAHTMMIFNPAHALPTCYAAKPTEMPAPQPA